VSPYRPLFIKVDYRWILPYAAVLGAILLLVADIGGRLLIAPQATQVAIVGALSSSTWLGQDEQRLAESSVFDIQSVLPP